MNTDKLADLSQEERIHEMDQVLLDLMDYTEQSDDEKIWCELHQSFRKMVSQYGYKLRGVNCPL
jgi:hypothetical protein